MDINQIVNNASEKEAKAALSYLLQHYMTPAFGALPKGEVELIVLNVLEQLKAIDSEPEQYELVSKLKVTRAKARRLMYDRELRSSSDEQLDEKVKALLKRPLIQKNGDLFVLEVENPLVSDHLRAKVQKLGYVSDGSFSPSLIKLGLDAIAALIESYLSDEEQDKVKKALIAAGAPDKSFRGVLKATLKKVSGKIASDTGEALMDSASEYISPILDGVVRVVKKQAGELFGDADK